MTNYLITIILPLLTLATGYLVGVERRWWSRDPKEHEKSVVYIARDHHNLKLLPDAEPFVDIVPDNPQLFIWRVPSGTWFRFQQSGPSGSWALSRLAAAQHRLDPELGEIVECHWTSFLMFEPDGWDPKNSLDEVRSRCLEKLPNSKQGETGEPKA